MWLQAQIRYLHTQRWNRPVAFSNLIVGAQSDSELRTYLSNTVLETKQNKPQTQMLSDLPVCTYEALSKAGNGTHATALCILYQENKPCFYRSRIQLQGCRINCFHWLFEMKSQESKLSHHTNAVQRKEMKEQANPFSTAFQATFLLGC